jgi:tetrahydromethanopterin S-methyltransferase subunit G
MVKINDKLAFTEEEYEAQISIGAKLARMVEDRGQEIERQAAEILALQTRLKELEDRIEMFRHTGQL